MSNAPDQPRRALGKGLSALLPATKPAGAAPAEPQAGPLRVPIELIDPNPLQPRKVFQADKLSELAQSIRENGLIQPCIVRRVAERYQLIAGERRLRAARLVGLHEIPVVVENVADDRILEVALIENIQREDLNPIEVAETLEHLVKDLRLSHEQIAQRTGKDRTTITNLLRLLRLPKEIQLLLAEHRLSMGHARAILGLPTPELQVQLGEKAASEGLSVRQVERFVQKMSETREPKTVEEVAQDPNVKAAVQELERTLGTRVRIVEKSEKPRSDRDRVLLLRRPFADLRNHPRFLTGESGAGGRS